MAKQKSTFKKREFGPEEDCGCVLRGQRQTVLVSSRSVAVIVTFFFVSLSIKMGKRSEIYTKQKFTLAPKKTARSHFIKPIYVELFQLLRSN